MVRVVFRPYPQIRRTICTSVSRRASTRVSPGFTLFRHRSPSFGSHPLGSDAVHTSCRTGPERQLSEICFHYANELSHSKTRLEGRLLGPCFKTGRAQLQLPSYTTHKSMNTTSCTSSYEMNLPATSTCLDSERVDWALLICVPAVPASLLASSSPISLSFQSAFHLSLTVLVRYRSLVNMEL